MVNGIIIKKINLVNFIIILVKFIKVFGKIIKKMDTVKCIIQSKFIIKVIGNKIRKMVMVNYMKMEIYFKVNL